MENKKRITKMIEPLSFNDEIRKEKKKRTKKSKQQSTIPKENETTNQLNLNSSQNINDPENQTINKLDHFKRNKIKSLILILIVWFQT